MDEEVRASGWGEDEERNYSKYVASGKIPSDEEEVAITSELGEKLDGEDFSRVPILDDAASNSSIEEGQHRNESFELQQCNSNNSSQCSDEDIQELSVEEEEYLKSKRNDTRRGIIPAINPQ